MNEVAKKETASIIKTQIGNIEMGSIKKKMVGKWYNLDRK